MKKKSILLFFIFIQLLYASCAYSAEVAGSAIITQMDKAEIIIYGEVRHGGLIDRLNELERVLFARSLPGSISERQLQLLNFIQTGGAGFPSLLFKLGVAEWAVSQAVQPSIPALGRLQKLEQELSGAIQEGKAVSSRVDSIIDMLFTEPVTQVEFHVSSDTVIKAQILESIGPGKSKKGDSVKIELVEDFMDNNYLIAPKGSRVVSEVSEVVRPGAFGRPGEVKLEFKYLEILGPEELKVKLADPRELDKRGIKNVGVAVGASMAGALLLGPLGLATGLLIRGDSLDVDSGAHFYLQMVEETKLSGYPIPEGLRKSEDTSSGTSPDLGSDSSNPDEIVIPDTPE